MTQSNGTVKSVITSVGLSVTIISVISSVLMAKVNDSDDKASLAYTTAQEVNVKINRIEEKINFIVDSIKEVKDENSRRHA